MVELTSLIGPPNSASTGAPAESQSALQRRAKLAWAKLVGITGYFDLDPNRVLDIVLDVFSANVLTHYSFFLALLRWSGWTRVKPSDGPDVGDSGMTVDDQPIGDYAGMQFQDVLKKAEEAARGKPSNTDDSFTPIISNILGFKITQYQVNTATCVLRSSD